MFWRNGNGLHNKPSHPVQHPSTWYLETSSITTFENVELKLVLRRTVRFWLHRSRYPLKHPPKYFSEETNADLTYEIKFVIFKSSHNSKFTAPPRNTDTKYDTGTQKGLFLMLRSNPGQDLKLSFSFRSHFGREEHNEFLSLLSTLGSWFYEERFCEQTGGA